MSVKSLGGWCSFFDVTISRAMPTEASNDTPAPLHRLERVERHGHTQREESYDYEV
jgi:hypothetical protein